mgnify:CR=1 FL=1
MRGFITPIATIVVSALVGMLLMNTLGLYQQTVLAFVGINVILAVSLNLVNGFTGQFSMGHVGFMAVGAYLSAWLSTVILPQFAIWNEMMAMPVVGQFLFFGLVIAGGLVAAGIGILVGIPSLRLKGDYLAIVTLGFGEIIRIFILNVEQVGGARGLIGIPSMGRLPWILGCAALTCVFCYRIVRSSMGKQFMAVRDDETATLSMGLSTTHIKVRSFAIASFFAGVAGVLFAHETQYLNPGTFTFNYSFQIIAMIVLGGLGSLTGSVVAASLLTFSLEFLRILQDLLGVDLRMIIYALILIIIMLTRPDGLFGQKELWTIWKRKVRA